MQILWTSGCSKVVIWSTSRRKVPIWAPNCAHRIQNVLNTTQTHFPQSPNLTKIMKTMEIHENHENTWKPWKPWKSMKTMKTHENTVSLKKLYNPSVRKLCGLTILTSKPPKMPGERQMCSRWCRVCVLWAWSLSVCSLCQLLGTSATSQDLARETPPLTHMKTWVLGHEVVLAISEVVYK